MKKRLRAPGMWPADGVERLDLAAEAIAARGRRSSCTRPRRDCSVPASMVGMRGRLRRIGAPRHCGAATSVVDVAAGGAPGRDAAVEHRHLGMAHPAQHPPGARGVHAALGVVADHGRRRRDARVRPRRCANCARSGSGWRPRKRPWRVLHGPRQVAVQVHVLRARQVALAPRALAGVGVRRGRSRSRAAPGCRPAACGPGGLWP